MDEKTDQKSLITTVMDGNRLMVVATQWQGKPQSALVAFSRKEEFELIFGTFVETRKYRNLIADPCVAVVIGWNDDQITVQYEGIASLVSGEERDQCVAIHLAKLPEAHIYSTMENERYFKICPTWIRYSDLSLPDQEKIFELSF
jgi:hypothetical protein